MKKIKFTVRPVRVTESAAFSEATAEELRVLLALIECGGTADSEQALSELAHTSRARCISALALWEAEGVISPSCGGIVEEFEERILDGELDEEPSVEVAKKIRDENLAAMLEECAAIMNTPALSTTDVKNISALYTQLSLSPEYVVALAAHMANGGRLTSQRLKDKAKKLVDSGCDSYEALEKYIEAEEERKTEDGELWEYRRIFGIYNRNLSPTERTYFKRWSNDFCFGVPIVSEAYDKTVMSIGKVSLQYMDKILTEWHEAGCQTVAECLAISEAGRTARAAEAAKTTKRSRTEPQKPRYGSFDVEDAFKHALQRSFTDED